MSNGVRILVIEDEAPIRRFLKACLEAQNYQLIEAVSGKEGLSLAATYAPDLVLLDLGLPDMDGLEVLVSLREFVTVPIIIISARGKEHDKIDGLDAGADDYLTKPFSVGELAARIRVALRHAARPGDSANLRIETGELTVDLDTRTVMLKNQEIRLTPTEYKVLALLARNAGKVITQNQIMKEVWGSDRIGQEHHVRVYLHQLRQKLEAEPARPRYLITEPWVGYRLKTED